MKAPAIKSDPVTIRNAIEDLEDSLRKGVAAGEAVEQSATDNMCAPALLKRAFESKHQCPPDTWQAPLSTLEMARRSASAKAQRKAVSAAEHDPLYGHARVPSADFLVPPGTIIAVEQAEIAVSYLLDRNWERTHARVVGVAVDLKKLAPVVGMQGESDTLIYIMLGAGRLTLPGLDGLSLSELQDAVLAHALEGQAGVGIEGHDIRSK